MAVKSKRITGPLRKANIIRAAGALFAEKGFSGTKTREIAVKAGVSEALIFKHFPSKEELYAAILAAESPVPHLLSKITLLAEHRQDMEVFTAIADTIVKGAPDSELMRLILFSALENHELSDMFFQNHIKVFYDFLAGYIQQRIDDGAFQPVPALIAARSFMGMLIYHRLVTVLFQAHVPHPAEEISRTFVNIMMHGVQAASSPQPVGSKRKTRRSQKRGPRKG